MIRARRAFFDNGYFDPFSDAVASMVAEGISRTASLAAEGAPAAAAAAPVITILDAGCGEGHYIGRVQQVQRRATSISVNLKLLIGMS